MEINVVLPYIGISGGVRVIFEYSNRLYNNGHEVNIIYPVIQPRMEVTWSKIGERIDQVKNSIHRYVSGPSVDWFDLEVPIKRVPTLSPKLIGHFEDIIPDADVTIATGWRTAYAVNELSPSKGAKAYFVQHYEIWKTWNSVAAWDQVTDIANNPSSYPVEMYEISPPKKDAAREKRLVDQSYHLPLSKITVSTWLAGLLREKFNEEVANVIPNSVNRSVFYPDRTNRSESLSILLPYREAPWKGQQEVKQLVQEIESSEIQFQTYGPDDSIDLPEHVTHHSQISDQHLRHLYSNADIFVFPSWVEGFGLPPLEAMACKCAVVSTDVGAVSDYAVDGVSACIVPPRDADALVEVVRNLIDNEEKRERLKQRGHERATKYTWDDAVAQLEDTLREIVNRGNRPEPTGIRG